MHSNQQPTRAERYVAIVAAARRSQSDSADAARFKAKRNSSNPFSDEYVESIPGEREDFLD